MTLEHIERPVFSVAERVGDAAFQLVSNNGLYAYVNAETEIHGDAVVAVGKQVWADVTRGEIDGRAALVVSRVFEITPSQADIDRLGRLLKRFEKAGVGNLGIDNPTAFLKHALATTPVKRRDDYDLREKLMKRFLRDYATFPDSWWHDDPEVGVREMAWTGCG